MSTVRVLPPIPNRGMPPDQYVSTTEALHAALPGWGSDINTVAGEVNFNANNAFNSAATASQKAADASASATAAANVAGAALWVSGTNYAMGQAAISRNNFFCYRSKTAGISTVDPQLDSSRWVLANGSPLVFQAQERQAQGIGVSANSADAWYTRQLNTVVWNDIPGASIANGNIALPTGIYDFEAEAQQYNASTGILILFDAQDNATILRGISSSSQSGFSSVFVSGRFSINSPRNVYLSHYVRTINTNFTNVLGYPAGKGFEVYSRVNIWKIQ